MGGKNGAVCVPTRASLMTGCTPFKASVNLGGAVIRPDRTTLGQHFRKSGYDTFQTGKWHNDVPSMARSFAAGRGIFLGGMTPDQRKVHVQDHDSTGAYDKSRVYLAPKFSTEFFCDQAVDYIRGHQGPAPFFVYAAFTAPHDPRTPPPEFASLYDPSKIPVPANFAERHPFDNGDLVGRDEKLAPFPRTPARIQKEIADYYGMISHIDANVGRVLQAIEESGQAKNTLIVYTADHGLALGQHGLLGKQNMYEHSTRVPLILHGAGVPTGFRSDALAYSWDLFPTLCDLAGIPTPSGLEARSLAPVLRGDTASHRTELNALYRDFQRMAKDDRWKLIEYSVQGQRHTQLFDLASDPWETKNLAGEQAQAPILRRLRERLAAWQAAHGDPLSLPA